jgi:hypothetical protein
MRGDYTYANFKHRLLLTCQWRDFVDDGRMQREVSLSQDSHSYPPGAKVHAIVSPGVMLIIITGIRLKNGDRDVILTTCWLIPVFCSIACHSPSTNSLSLQPT